MHIGDSVWLCKQRSPFFNSWMSSIHIVDWDLSPNGWSPPSFRIYVKHYLICLSVIRKRESVCASTGCSRQTGYSVWPSLRGQMLLYVLVLCTCNVKLVVQSCPKKVRRSACGIISLFVSHKIELVSFPAKTNTDATEARVFEQVSIIPHNGKSSIWKRLCFFVWPESACKSANAQLRLQKSCLSNCHFVTRPVRAGGIMGVV